MWRKQKQKKGLNLTHPKIKKKKWTYTKNKPGFPDRHWNTMSLSKVCDVCVVVVVVLLPVLFFFALQTQTHEYRTNMWPYSKFFWYLGECRGNFSTQPFEFSPSLTLSLETRRCAMLYYYSSIVGLLPYFVSNLLVFANSFLLLLVEVFYILLLLW